MPQAKLHLARESRLYKELSALLRSMFLVVELSSQSASSTASAARCPAVVSRHDEVTRADHPSQSHVAAPKQYGFRRLAMLEVELPSSIITHHDMTSARAILLGRAPFATRPSAPCQRRALRIGKLRSSRLVVKPPHHGSSTSTGLERLTSSPPC